MTPTTESTKDDFQRARRRAGLEEIMAALTGRSANLLSYEEVRQKVRGVRGNARKLKDVPLDSIVGSVGRVDDFTRSFLPRRDSDEERWARVEQLAHGGMGLPPVELFQIGDVYFVNDGNHRVSVARQSGLTHIEAYVTEVHTRVPLSPDVQPDDLIIKAEYATFLDCTRLDVLRPKADFTATSSDAYAELLEHIEVHRYFMGIDQKREIPFEEAVTHWYDTIYSPVVEVIKRGDLLSDFTGRTHTDLYLWISKYRAELEKELDWEIRTETAAAEFVAKRSKAPDRVLSRVGKKILEKVVPPAFDAGPPAGEWRRERVEARPGGAIFIDILVAVSADATCWRGLDLGVQIARNEGARIHGLHVAPSEDDVDSERINALRVTFNRRCHEAGVPGRLAVEVGEVPETICERARWSDLVVLDRTPSTTTEKLGDTLHDIIQHCGRPILFVPGPAQELKRALLVYDGSPKAKEAVFVAAYLAKHHNLSLALFATKEGDQTAMQKTLEAARSSLRESSVEAPVVAGRGPIPEAVLACAAQAQSDLIIMGGYSQQPLFASGTTLDEILRTTPRPVLICR